MSGPSFPLPTGGTAWASGGVSGRFGGKSMRRSRGLRQKPWNKPTRMEKFWAVNAEMPNNGAPYVVPGGASTNATYCAGIDGQVLASDQTGTVFPRALQHVKLHRFQGAIWAWLSPDFQRQESNAWDGTAGPGGLETPANVGMLSYAWFKQTETANVPGPGTVVNVTNFNPRPGQDLANMLLRDDIMSWGTMPVFGITPRLFNEIVHTNGTPGIAAAITTMLSPAAQYYQSRVARIPFPRLPKAGLNLRKGESLMLACAAWPGPGAHNGLTPSETDPLDNDVLVYPLYRMLCSI